MANPQIQQIRTMLAENPIAPEGASIEEMRNGFNSMAAGIPSLPNVSSEAVDAGGIPARWFRAEGCDPTRTVLYFHGGGYVIGSIDSHRPLLERLAVATGGQVLALDYRLAPEHPFPAAVEDAAAAHRWLLGQGAEAGRIAFAGDSAGGGLTVAALLKVRDSGEALPACGVAISPWVDMECLGETMETKAAEDPMVQREAVQGLAQVYLNGADPRSPLASPLHGDLAGLPPLLIQVGSAETLLDDSNRLASKLKTAGCDATLEVWDEMIHVWHLFAPMLDKGQEAIDVMAEFIRKRTS